MKLFLVKHAWNTQGWIYSDRESAEKRLSSGLKCPEDHELYDIIEVDAPDLKEYPKGVIVKIEGIKFIK